MMKYRKKPIEIEAFRFGVEDPPMHARPSWFVAAITRGQIWYQGGDEPYYTIRTLEGEMRANHGDWIIQGVIGEIYPCKPDIFAATYDPVPATSDPAGLDLPDFPQPSRNQGERE